MILTKIAAFLVHILIFAHIAYKTFNKIRELKLKFIMSNMYYISYYFRKSQYKSYQTSSRKRKYQLVAKDGLFEYIKKHINISIA